MVKCRSDGTSEWHMGPHFQRFPNTKALWAGERDSVLKEHVFKGLIPDSPILGPTDPIVVLGACFARQIADALPNTEDWSGDLEKAGLHVFAEHFGNNLVLLRYLQWAAGLRDVQNDETLQITQYGLHKRAGRKPRMGKKTVKLPMDEAARTAVLGALTRARAIILTPGLTEAWLDKKTKEAFVRAINVESFDPKRHVFKVMTVAENKRYLKEIVGVLRAINKDIIVVLVVTPQRLRATFTPNGSVTSDIANKAILRAAMDEFMSANKDPNVYYFPAFDMIQTCYEHSVYRESDGRHVDLNVVKEIFEHFKRYFIRST